MWSHDRSREWWNLGVDFARSRPPKNRPASNAIATDRLCGCGTCLPAFPLSANEASTEIVQESAVELAALTSVVGGRLNSVGLERDTLRGGPSGQAFTSYGSPIMQEDPLNLSILLRGGKETNKDSLSKGD